VSALALRATREIARAARAVFALFIIRLFSVSIAGDVLSVFIIRYRSRILDILIGLFDRNLHTSFPAFRIACEKAPGKLNSWEIYFSL
jgi:hypothetical protein